MPVNAAAPSMAEYSAADLDVCPIGRKKSQLTKFAEYSMSDGFVGGLSRGYPAAELSRVREPWSFLV
jgi:hypothetical protein